jgi:Putative Flp pilus-assembly TadE/G-like
MTHHFTSRQRRRGSIAPLTAVLLIPILALTALAIDLSYLELTRTQLQNAADAAAVAAATEMLTNKLPEDQTKSRNWASEFASMNKAAGATVVIAPQSDVQYGYWNASTRLLEAAKPNEPNVKINAVRVLARRSPTAGGGAVPLFFARIFGVNKWNMQAEGVAYVPNPTMSPISPGRGSRFLIDDEMLDTDEPPITSLANSLGKTPDWLLTAKNETSANPADWFLNLPADTILNLPTGQVGDEGLLDIAANEGNPSLGQYPFTSQADHTKFLKYNNTSNNDAISQMRKGLFSDSQLDPLAGVGRFNQPSRYPELVNPDFVHVSPVYKSDVSALNGVQQANASAGADLNNDGTPDGYTTNQPVDKGVCAKDYRRGLLAFKIIGYNLDPSKPYPYLPRLTIKIVDPATIDLNAVPAITNTNMLWDYKAGGAKNVRLVK